MSAPTGLGYGARLIYDSLKAQGWSPNCIDITGLFLSKKSSNKLTVDQSKIGGGPLIFHVNATELLYVIDKLGHRNIGQQKIIAIWAWEQTIIPKTWLKVEKFVDEIWASSHFLEDIFKKNLETPVYYTPYPVTSPSDLSDLGTKKKSETFKVLTAFDPRSGIDRKNPQASIEVFQRCFPTNSEAELTVKVSDPDWPIPDSWRRIKNIKINNAILTDEDMESDLKTYDCVMSLHRSEGFGFLIASALAHGIPTIFTEGFGSEDFSDCPGAYKVPGEPFKIQNNDPHYKNKYGSWIDPNLEIAQSHLHEIHNLTPLQRVKTAESSLIWWETHYNSARFCEAIPISTRTLFSGDQT